MRADRSRNSEPGKRRPAPAQAGPNSATTRNAAKAFVETLLTVDDTVTVCHSKPDGARAGSRNHTNTTAPSPMFL